MYLTRFALTSSIFSIAIILSAASSGAQEIATEGSAAASAGPEAVVKTLEFSVPAESETMIRRNQSSTQSQRQAKMVAKLRLQRGMAQAQQRAARLERNRWHGYKPLRPNWSSMSTISTAHVNQHITYVPVIIRH